MDEQTFRDACKEAKEKFNEWLKSMNIAVDAREGLDFKTDGTEDWGQRAWIVGLKHGLSMKLQRNE